MRVRPHRKVMIDGVLVRDGGEAMVPVGDADALTEQRLVKKPGLSDGARRVGDLRLGSGDAVTTRP